MITADLPEGIEYRITEQTNTMDSKTYDAVANNLIDSGVHSQQEVDWVR